MSLDLFGFLVDLLIWDWAWLGMPLVVLLVAMALHSQSRRIAVLSMVWALVGGAIWIAACHLIDWLVRGIWLLALPVAYRHEFGSGFFFVGGTALLVYILRKYLNGGNGSASEAKSAL
jgi:hypothetical protein